MTTVFSEQQLNNNVHCQNRKTLSVALLCVTGSLIVTSFVLKSSLKSKLIFLSQYNNKKDKLITPCYQDSIFNRDIAISYVPENMHRRASKFRCTGSENDIQAWSNRLCVFYNTCYNRDSGSFYYFRLPGRKAKPLFYDSAKGMLFEFSKNTDRVEFVSLTPDGGTPWGPIITNETYPIENFTRLYRLHILMQNRFADSNIAHGLWEDFGSISYSMERMNLFDRNLVIMHLGQMPNTKLFQIYHQYIVPALTENAMVEFETYVASFKTKYVCFDTLIAGGQLSVFQMLKTKENDGREALFYSWRSKIIKYSGFDSNFVPKKHHIIITNKSHSLWTNSRSNRHRAIANLKEVDMFIKHTYPNISSEVVEWHTIPFKRQIEKLLKTTILITPCGGVSLIIPMLPNGAHAIVMDYYVSVAAYGFHPGESGSMEGAFLNHIPHIRKQYYQVYGKSDYEFDYPGTSDTREQASIIVNMTRLQLLVDKALEEMEP